MKRIKIFDTTLRDGEQSPGCSMNLKEKIEMARQLEKLGVDVIEAGFAIASPMDHKSVKAVAGAVEYCTVASLARCVKGDIDAAWDAVKEAKHPRIHVFLATSDIHMEYKLQMTRPQVLERISEMVAYAKSFCEDIEFSAEDASRSDHEFLAQCYTRAIAAGATTINVPDTVGYATPQEMGDLIRYLKGHVEGIGNVDISVHCHDDLGMGVANSLASIMAGATQVECTVNGIGERAGNASLEEIVMALQTRRHYYRAETNINTRQIYRSSKLLSNITGVAIAPSKAIVGANAFAHESGIHQHGVIANALSKCTGYGSTAEHRADSAYPAAAAAHGAVGAGRGRYDLCTDDKVPRSGHADLLWCAAVDVRHAGHLSGIDDRREFPAADGCVLYQPHGKHH